MVPLFPNLPHPLTACTSRDREAHIYSFFIYWFWIRLVFLLEFFHALLLYTCRKQSLPASSQVSSWLGLIIHPNKHHRAEETN